MSVDPATVETVIRDFLVRVRKPSDFTPETALHADGLNLDSLETAELSAVLEDNFEVDPFSSESIPPDTIGGIFDYYAKLPATS